MQHLLANTRFLLGAAVAVALSGLAYGYAVRDFNWLARSGAIVVAIGLVLLSRASVIGQDLRTHITMADTNLSSLNPEHYRQVGEPVPGWLVEELASRKAVGFWGPLVSAAGTVIWGFGDLLNRLT